MQCAAGEIRGKEPGDAGSELKSRRRRTTMDNRMFCFQCEQTALCTGCTGKAGVCGKTAEVEGVFYLSAFSSRFPLS